MISAAPARTLHTFFKTRTCTNVLNYFLEPREIPRWFRWCTACEEWLEKRASHSNYWCVRISAALAHTLHTFFPNRQVCECAELFLGTSGNTKMTSLMHSMWGMACKRVSQNLQIVFVRGFEPHPHARVRMCEIISWNLGKYQDDFVDAQHVRNGLQKGVTEFANCFCSRIWAAPARTCANVRNYFLEPREIPRWLRWCTACEEWLAKRASQYLHLWGFSPVWIFVWSLNCWLLAKLFPHSSQLWM